MINVSDNYNYISIGGKRRRIERASCEASKMVEDEVKLGKRKRIDDEFVSYKIRRIDDIVEEVHIVEEVAEVLCIPDVQEVQKKQLEKQKRQQKYKLKKQQQQWLVDQNKQRKIAREKADYEDLIREIKRQRTVAFANICIASDEWLSEQKRIRQMGEVFADADAKEFMCEQKRRRMVVDREFEMEDIMYIKNK